MPIIPNELRIAIIRSELHEMRIAAERGDVTDDQTVELGNIAEQAIETWRNALRVMVKRMGERVELVQCPSCDALVPLAEAHHHES
jgi:hypothetical protein